MCVDSFDQVFRQYYTSLVVFARKMVRDKPAAEDIVMDVFCKLWQKQVQFASTRSAKALLYISTRNACINYRDRAARQSGARQRILNSGQSETEDFVLNQIIRAEVSRQLLMQLEKLPTQCRKVMRMSFIEGFSNRQIATQLQLSINTVRNQKARGIHLIRKRMV
jgi:RNA polymerase sigma-70 factor (family 1)